VGRVSGQFSHQVIRLRVDDVCILCACVAQLLELRHDRGACIFAAGDGPYFLALGECRDFCNSAQHLSCCCDLSGFAVRVNDYFDQTLYNQLAQGSRVSMFSPLNCQLIGLDFRAYVGTAA
jgi:hypothetical protein